MVSISDLQLFLKTQGSASYRNTKQASASHRYTKQGSASHRYTKQVQVQISDLKMGFHSKSNITYSSVLHSHNVLMK